MIVKYEFKDKSFIAMEGSDIKYWFNTGLPDYEGTLDSFAEAFPLHMQELIKNKVVKIKT